jgi:hypothetical protein
MASVLWLTDRSRYETGLSFCPRARLLEYHGGPSGYGMRRTAESLPLARGIYVHEAIGALLQTCLANGDDYRPDAPAIRVAVQAATTKYRQSIEARGLAQVAEPEQLQTTIAEQCALITGLTWCFGLEFLPWFLEEYELIAVEQEDIAVLDCSCGLGDLLGLPADHEARGCAGIGWQCRPDIIARHRRTQAYSYWELKSASAFDQRFETGWETKVQFSAGVLGAEQRLSTELGEQVRIDEMWVVGLLAGSRWAKDGEPRRQNSLLCYGYFQPGQPPIRPDTWEWEYENQERKPIRLPRSYQKRGVWLGPFDGMPEGMDPAEYWVRWLPAEARKKQLGPVGPLNRQQVLLDGFKQELIAEERDWQQRLWQAHDVYERVGGDWSHPEYQGVLNQLFRRSWACDRFGREYGCQFKGLCLQHEGWQDPIGSDRFVLRAPHHQPEADQMVARGVALPEALLQDDQEEG